MNKLHKNNLESINCTYNLNNSGNKKLQNKFDIYRLHLTVWTNNDDLNNI